MLLNSLAANFLHKLLINQEKSDAILTDWTQFINWESGVMKRRTIKNIIAKLGKEPEISQPTF